jgi:hypothetical protein
MPRSAEHIRRVPMKLPPPMPIVCLRTPVSLFLTVKGRLIDRFVASKLRDGQQRFHACPYVARDRRSGRGALSLPQRLDRLAMEIDVGNATQHLGMIAERWTRLKPKNLY